MAAICIRHPDDPNSVFGVPAPKPPHTFEEVYGSAGYELVENCPPMPAEVAGEQVKMTAEVRKLVDAAKADDKLEDK